LPANLFYGTGILAFSLAHRQPIKARIPTLLGHGEPIIGQHNTA
jgi:hypothetical protein